MEFLSDFGVQPILLLAQVVNFLVLLWILKKLLYKPILKILEERKQKIAQSLKNAEEIEKRLDELSEQEQKRIIKAVSEGEKIIKQAQEEGVQLIEGAKIKAEGLAEKIVEDAKEKLKLEREKIQQDLKEELSEIVEVSLKKVIEGSLSSKDQKNVILQATKQIKI